MPGKTHRPFFGLVGFTLTCSDVEFQGGYTHPCLVRRRCLFPFLHFDVLLATSIGHGAVVEVVEEAGEGVLIAVLHNQAVTHAHVTMQNVSVFTSRLVARIV